MEARAEDHVKELRQCNVNALRHFLQESYENEGKATVQNACCHMFPHVLICILVVFELVVLAPRFLCDLGLRDYMLTFFVLRIDNNFCETL